MLSIVLVMIIVTPLIVVFLVPLARRRSTKPDPELESAAWRPAIAEVISVLQASNQTFLLVRYHVGTTVIRNDIRYPLPGPVPTAGDRVPVRYDPSAPAKVVFDPLRVAKTPARAR